MDPGGLDATVIVTAYQQAETIDLLMHALGRQDYDGAWEIIVVDDGSTDLCANIVAAHADRLPVSVTYVRQPDRGNRWARARNLGIRLSRGGVLLMLDGDMVPATDVVRLHVEQQHREPGLLAG